MFSKFRLAPWQLAVLASAFIFVADNRRFIDGLLASLDPGSWTGMGFLLLTASLIILVLTTLMLALGIGPMFRAVVVTMLVASAALGYFVDEMSIVFDDAMLANIADTITERNAAEARELVSWPFTVHLLLYGFLPSVLVGTIRLQKVGPWRELRARALVIATLGLLTTALLLGNYRYATFFGVEHRDLRLSVTPVFAIVSLARQVHDSLRPEPAFRELDSRAEQTLNTSRRVVGIMVVGETARADHFSLNGYDRNTNPLLSGEDNLLFVEAEACGTSTAFSVPCMFFLRSHQNYSPEIARSESNVLDTLAAAGVETIWLDNNSSCKHVCNRIPHENLRLRPDGSILEDGEYDIGLVAEAEHRIDTGTANTLIVLHTMGSHGPAYSERYPEDFARFVPFCHKLSPKECSPPELTNAYDNTILYTYYVVDSLIKMLQTRAESIDSFVFYASDHGESLGENGVYLHGLPRAVAPQSQTRVPLILWLSPGYVADTHTAPRLALDKERGDVSHDNIPHTLLGLFGIDSGWYRREADLLRHAQVADQRIALN
jgi:lipid A ethanolaminephosphotransferase